jgi:circadian clock protein KaiB
MAEKTKPTVSSSTQEFEEAITTGKNERYVLKLYITGMTPRSQRAIANIKKICEEYLKDNYELEVIDIYQQPSLAKGEQIIAVPTLIKKLPLPLRRLIGDISQEEKIILGLDLRPKPKQPAPKVREGKK